jgi:formylglycine-generating enzyme required for sulfatase activity
MTPLELAIPANTEHQLRLSKSGYTTVEKNIRLDANEKRELSIKLQAQYATVFLSTTPANAQLQIDGQTQAQQNGRFQLSVRPHTFTLSKPGYVSQTLSVTPRRGVSQSIQIKLEPPKQPLTPKKKLTMPPEIASPGGQNLLLIKPDSSFTMGASRREAGRRANESRRLILLSRPFYMADKETTNQEYRLFQPAHDSGSLDGASLNGEQQPVVNISWDDAARYCNWLSKKQGLPASYIEEKGKMRARQPMTTGYRLPTEAEWAWVARRHQQPSEQRYPWAGSYPPRIVSGNYADTRISDTLADVVPDYDDGYRGTAAVGSFVAQPVGFYDLGGNAAEWVHDYYAIYPGEATQLTTNPAGPPSGSHHVVRGASWRHGNITELRLSYRDYSRNPRYDLGFRIARYAE